MCESFNKFHKIIISIFIMLLTTILYSGVSYCAVDVVASSFKGNTLDVYDYCIKDYFGDVDIYDVSIWANSTYLSNFQDCEDLVYSADYIAIYKRDNSSLSNNLYFVLSNSDIDWANNYNNTAVTPRGLAPSYAFTLSRSNNGKYSVSFSTPIEFKNYNSTGSGVDSTGYLLMYTTNGWYELVDGSISTDDIVTPTSFAPSYDNLININGISSTVYNFRTYLGGVPNTTIWGQFSDNFNNFVVQVDLYKFFTLEHDTLIARSYFYNSTFGSGQLKLDSNNNLYCNDNLLEYDTLYGLMIYVYNSYEDFSSRQPLTSYYYNYYITRPTSAIGTGATINYSGNNNYNDVSNIPNTENNTNDNTEVVGIINNFLSGDLSSNMGYVQYDDTYYDFLYNMWLDMYDVLISSNDVVLTFNIKDEYYVLRSSQFVTPPSVLKTFMTSFLIFGFFVVMYQQLAGFIHEIQEGNLYIMHDTDADVYFYKM